MKKILALLAGAALMATAGTAMAADSTTLTVEAEVLGVCSVVTDTNIDFGNLDPINDPANTTASSNGTAGSVIVTCTNGTSYSLLGPTATVAMTLDGGGSNPIEYTPTIPAGTFTGSMSGVSHTIDATVEKTAYQSVPAGSYTGDLTITVSY